MADIYFGENRTLWWHGLEMVQSGIVDPAKVLTKQGPLLAAVDAYKACDEREPGWMKGLLEPQAPTAGRSDQLGYS